MLTNKIIKQIQNILEGNKAGFRSVPRTTLKNLYNEVMYTPPQDKQIVEEYMPNLEEFINDEKLSDLDPLIKMAIIHHQFESIHPLYDGNGRTGRIISILYLVINNLLDLPILYLSRYITNHKGEYYELLQAIRDSEEEEKQAEAWRKWILFNLKGGVETTAQSTIVLVKSINQLMTEYKQVLRPLFGRQYKHELLNNLFFHPYTKIEFMEREMQVQSKTATKYLNTIVETNLLQKTKVGRINYYVNSRLIDLFINHRTDRIANVESIESVHETKKRVHVKVDMYPI